MKFTEHKSNGENQFSSSEPHRVVVNGVAHEASLWMSATTLQSNWPIKNISQLDLNLLEPIFALQPEVILLGSGADFCFPSIELMKAVKAKSIALDVMDTKACCRTFNVLTSEGRHVVAAVILPG
jgi:uncharacterized protein